MLREVILSLFIFLSDWCIKKSVEFVSTTNQPNFIENYLNENEGLLKTHNCRSSKLIIIENNAKLLYC